MLYANVQPLEQNSRVHVRMRDDAERDRHDRHLARILDINSGIRAVPSRVNARGVKFTLTLAVAQKKKLCYFMAS